MLIYSGNKPLKLCSKPDSDAMLYYTFYLKPPAWIADTEKIEGDIVSPTTPTGYYYQVISSGVTGSTEPTWGTVKNGETTDNTVTYKATNNNAYLSANATLVTTVTPPEFSATDSVPVANESFTTAGKADVQVGPVPAGVTQFTLTLKFYTDTGHATNEYDEQSIIVNVTDR